MSKNMSVLRRFFGYFRGTFRGTGAFRIEVEWCDEDKVFIASSDDVDGLVLEAESIDEMIKNLHDVVPMLLEANGQVDRRRENRNDEIDVHFKDTISTPVSQAQFA